MKYIFLVLIMVVGVLYSDDELIAPDWSYIFIEEDSVLVEVYGHKIRTNENGYIAAPIIRLLQFYEEYEKECYADSSMVYLGNGWSRQINGKKVTEYWTHTEPTFQGYMSFLKEKFKF